MKSARPFLMFQGEGAAALAFYETIFPDLVIPLRTLTDDGKIAQALLSLRGLEVMVFDSPPVHDFTFTPAFSFFLECEDEAEIERLSNALAEGGKVMMPLGDHGFSHRFAWIADRFGISWQLNLA